jgi:tRNA(Glu) U13 pseudouridine synthase TruD
LQRIFPSGSKKRSTLAEGGAPNFKRSISARMIFILEVSSYATMLIEEAASTSTFDVLIWQYSGRA